MVFVCLYLVGKVWYIAPLQSRPTYQNSSYFPVHNIAARRVLLLLCLSPLYLAFWCGASRLHDYWHHPSDVIAGAIIGTGSSIIGYSLFYPFASFGVPLLSNLGGLHRRESDSEAGLISSAV